MTLLLLHLIVNWQVIIINDVKLYAFKLWNAAQVVHRPRPRVISSLVNSLITSY